MPSPNDAAIEHLHAGRPAQAEALLRRALQRDPRNPEANRLMGMALGRMGRIDQARFYFERALAGVSGPSAALVRLNLGNVLLGAGRAGEALPVLREAAAGMPESPEAWNSLGAAATAAWSLDEALEACEHARSLAPDHPHVLLNLGSCLGASGDAEASVDVLQRAATLSPHDPHVLSTLLMASNYDERMSPGERARLHRDLGARLASLATATGAAGLDGPTPRRASGQKVRVGYLSFDLRRHVVAVFMRGLLAGHDRARHEVFAYQTGPEDEVSRELAALVDHWVSAGSMSDADLLARIRRDRLDVLIDLSGHTDGSRPMVLAARAAPVQATYLGYPNTTGIPAVDWRIVDADTDPPDAGTPENATGEADGWCTERLIRLPRCFLAYSPPIDAPEPTRAGGPGEPVTFGSFNNAAKINPPLLRAWARVLLAVPGSRLLIKNRAADCRRIRTRWSAVLAEAGVGPERVEFRGWSAEESNHLAAYREVDVALDTFPYHGTTTTCESLWMGVPVVSRAGPAHVSRVGVSLLRAVGLHDLIAPNDEGYVALAAGLASNADRRAVLRADLRRRTRESPLCDGAGLARAMDGAIDRMIAERSAR